MKKKIQGTRSNFFHFSTSNQVCMPVFFQLDISFDPQFKQKNAEKARIYYLFSFFGLFGGFSLREGPKIDGLPHILGLLNQKSITLSNPFRWVILVLPYFRFTVFSSFRPFSPFFSVSQFSFREFKPFSIHLSPPSLFPMLHDIGRSIIVSVFLGNFCLCLCFTLSTLD